MFGHALKAGAEARPAHEVGEMIHTLHIFVAVLMVQVHEVAKGAIGMAEEGHRGTTLAQGLGSVQANTRETQRMEPPRSVLQVLVL